MDTFDRLKGQQAALDVQLRDAAAQRLADLIAQTLEDGGFAAADTIEITLEAASEYDGRGYPFVWPELTYGADTDEAAAEHLLEQDLLAWGELHDLLDAELRVTGSRSFYDLAGQSLLLPSRSPALPDGLVRVAAEVGCDPGKVTGVAWVTVGVGGPPVHLEVAFETAAGRTDCDYLYPGELAADARDAVETLVAALGFDRIAPDSVYDTDRAEWLWSPPARPTADPSVPEPASEPAPAAASGWVPRSQTARKAAITAVTTLVPTCNRSQAAEALRAGTDPTVATVAQVYATDRPDGRQVAELVAALITRLGREAGHDAHVVDGLDVVVVRPDGASVRSGPVQLHDPQHPTGRERDWPYGWSHAQVIGRSGRLLACITTGLPSASADPLRIARKLLATAAAADRRR